MCSYINSKCTNCGEQFEDAVKDMVKRRMQIEETEFNQRLIDFGKLCVWAFVIWVVWGLLTIFKSLIITWMILSYTPDGINKVLNNPILCKLIGAEPIKEAIQESVK